jgi:hypothetical protein
MATALANSRTPPFVAQWPAKPADHLDGLAQNADPGIGHHHIELSEASLGGLDHPRPVLLDAHILMQADRFTAGGDDLARYRLRAGIVDVGDDDLGAFTRQSRRACSTNSRRSPRYDRDLALYLAHRVLPFCPTAVSRVHDF